MNKIKIVISFCACLALASCSTPERLYEIVWENDNGDVLLTEQYHLGEMPSFKGDDPQKESNQAYTYIFSGWAPAISEVTCSTTYTATYDSILNSYKITWKNFNDVVLFEEYYNYGQSPSYKGDIPYRPADNYYSYTFSGWDKTIAPVTKDETYTATFSESVNYYLVTWKNSDGSIIITEKHKYGDRIEYNYSTPVAPNQDEAYVYTFDGWDNKDTVVTGDMEFVAIYSVRQKRFHAVFSGEGVEAKHYYSDLFSDIEDFAKQYTVVKNPNNGLQFSFLNWVFMECSDGVYYYDAVFESCDSGFVFDGGTLVKYTGSNYNVVIPETWAGKQITSIGAEAFLNCNQIKNITIPKCVTSIGNRAFQNCSSLVSISIPNGITTLNSSLFYGCSSLESVVLPNSLVSIGSSCFMDCTSLSSIVIPNGVVSIFSQAFYDCTSLESIIIPDSVVNLSSGIFAGCTSLESVVIGDGVTSISGRTFERCSSLKTLFIGESVTTIGDNYNSLTSIFSDCSSLESIIVNDNNPVYSSLNGVLLNKETLTICCVPKKITGSFEIPEGFINFTNVFKDCIYLTSVTIPSGVTSLPGSLFRGCTSLESVTLPDTLEVIGGYSFYDCSSLTSIEIPNSVSLIGSHAFSNCSSLTSIEIPSNVTTIEDFAFSGCKSLTSITINDGVSYIGRAAFAVCSSVTSIVIPDSVTYIGSSIFSGCSSLEALVLPFVGKENKLAYTEDNLFGTLFGASEYENSVKVSQYYLYSTQTGQQGSGSPHNHSYYIPASLKSVTITDACNGIRNGAFGDCSMIEEIRLPVSRVSYLFGTYNSINNSYPYSYYNLKTIVLSDKCLSIDENFRIAKNLENFVVSSSVNEIKELLLNDALKEKCIEYDNALYFGNEDNPYLILISSINTNITSCEINENCRFINQSAFSGCSKISSITIPASVVSIGKNAFASCTSLSSVNLFNGLKTIYDSAFCDCSSLLSITFPDSVTSVKQNVFRGCSNLRTITIGNGALNFDPIGFQTYYYLTTVIVGDNYLSTSGRLTDYLPSRVFNSPGNGKYLGNNENPYSHLVKYPDLTYCTIHKDCKYILDHAFENCIKLTEIDIPDGVLSIGSSAFLDCSVLTTVVFPHSLVHFDSQDIFGNCNKLQYIFYKGTFDEWKQIDNYFSSDKLYFFSEELPSTNGNYWHYVDGVPTVW